MKEKCDNFVDPEDSSPSGKGQRYDLGVHGYRRTSRLPSAVQRSLPVLALFQLLSDGVDATAAVVAVATVPAEVVVVVVALAPGRGCGGTLQMRKEWRLLYVY